MTTDDSSGDERETLHGESTGGTAIYLLVGSAGNERVLRDWVVDHDSYELADETDSVRDAEFDLCIVDQEGLKKNADELRQTKSRAEPVLVPVLLLLPERRREVIETDQEALADNVFATTVDEIVSLPIRQAELEWRIKALLRLRNQSLTSQRKTEKLRQFREAVEASGHGIFITDPDGTIEYANPALEEITGYRRSDVLGKTPSVLKSGEMSESFYANLWETILAGEIWEEEIINRKKDGEEYIAYQTIAPILDESDEVDAFVAVQTDITERKRLEDRLKRHRDIVQRLEDPIMMQDKSGSFDLVNPAITEFTGIPERDLLGEDEYSIMDEEAAATIETQKNDVVETEEPAEYTIAPTFEQTGKEAIFSTRRYPYYDESDELAGSIAVCRDITDLEKRTRQLRVIDNILRHNLRNSLSVIRTKAEQLRAEASGTTPEAVEAILDEATELETTGEKSRAITKVLSKKPERKSIGLSTTVRSIAESFRTEFPEASIDVSAPDRLVVSATYDIDEAIEELLRNAIEHNDQETPAVDLTVRETDDGVNVHITDNGPGIAKMDREVLETGRAVEDLYHGSGLGLWLVYWIVNRSNGEITVSASKPQGTTVSIKLETAAEFDENRH